MSKINESKRITRRSLISSQTNELLPVKVDVIEKTENKKKRTKSQLEKLIEDANKDYRNNNKKNSNLHPSFNDKSPESKRKKLSNKSPSKNDKSIEGKKKNSIYAELSEDDESITNDDDSDEEYKEEEDEIEVQEEEEEDEEESEKEEYFKPITDKTKKNGNKLIMNKKTSNNKKKKEESKLNESKPKETEKVLVASSEEEIKKFEIIKEWSYELDEETKYFKYPKIPNLDDSILDEYISRKTNKNYQIYSCPYCEKVFTYSLCFKTHLYSCSKSPHAEFLYLCAFGDGNNEESDKNNHKKQKKCNYKSNKKQCVIDHYRLKHLDDDKSVLNKQKTRNNHLHINSNSYSFVKNYYLNYIIKNYKKLSLINDDYQTNCYDLKTNNQYFDSKVLEFKLNTNQCIQLNAFESYKTSNYELINLCEHIQSLDWCYLKQDSLYQYLAISTRPIKNLFEIIDLNSQESANLIYFYKCDKNQETEVVNCLNNKNVFAILNRDLGDCYCLKWRPDCGVVANDKSLGYILATSTNGYSYIYLVENMFNNNENTNNNEFKVYEPCNEIRLKSDNKIYGQCTTGDWSQLNGATKIALGYSNGSILLFDIDNRFYFEYLNNDDTKIVEISPYKCINAHITFVKTLKWSKLDEFLLASGSSFSRELK
jgi:hypothetical protein